MQIQYTLQLILAKILSLVKYSKLVGTFGVVTITVTHTFLFYTHTSFILNNIE